MSVNTYDWSRFTVRINVNAAGKTLYDAWATRDGMERGPQIMNSSAQRHREEWRRVAMLFLENVEISK